MNSNAETSSPASSSTPSSAPNGAGAHAADGPPKGQTSRLQPFGALNLKDFTVDELLEKLAAETAILNQMKAEEARKAEEDRRKKVYEIPQFLGVADLNQAIVLIRSVMSGGKATPITAGEKSKLDEAILAGMTAPDAKKHLGVSPATYYKAKNRLGLTKKYNYEGGAKSRNGGTTGAGAGGGHELRLG